MQKELLSPDTFTKQLQSRRQQLQKVLDLKQKSQKTAPQGHLKIMRPVDGRPCDLCHPRPRPRRGRSPAAVARGRAALRPHPCALLPPP